MLDSVHTQRDKLIDMQLKRWLDRCILIVNGVLHFYLHLFNKITCDTPTLGM
jgi:hypothetical protein